uniref:U5 small nuclear ribonucleoprotein TSSC4 n=1 Tax=Arion vulgaris TaxID=1028688 RepID=A0A0B6YAW4_9EUPU
MEEEVSSFSLRTGADSFVSRTRDVFASLGVLEDKHSAFLKASAPSRDGDDIGLIKNDPDEDDEFVHENKNDAEGCRSWSHGRSQLSKTEDSDYESRSCSRSPNRDNYDSKFRSRSPNRDNGSGTAGDGSPQDVDGDFKRPARPTHKLNRKSIPDFKKNPDKYTLYSLEDVSEQEMSETSNQRAAFDFLEENRLVRETQDRKLAGLPEEEPKFDVVIAACSQGKIPFSHPKQKKHQENVPEKSISKDGGELPTLKLSSLVQSDNDLDTKSPGSESITDEPELDSSLSETNTCSKTFKSRKNVKRHIRAKVSDADSD